jgi:hypothetical protein
MGLLHYAVHSALAIADLHCFLLGVLQIIFTICLPATCHVPVSNGSLLFTVKPKIKENVLIPAMLFYILKKQKKNAKFWEELIAYFP